MKTRNSSSKTRNSSILFIHSYWFGSFFDLSGPDLIETSEPGTTCQMGLLDLGLRLGLELLLLTQKKKELRVTYPYVRRLTAPNLNFYHFEV